MTLLGPDDEVVWEATFEEDGGDGTAVTAERDGSYVLEIQGENTSGSYEVNWEVAD